VATNFIAGERGALVKEDQQRRMSSPDESRTAGAWIGAGELCSATKLGAGRADREGCNCTDSTTSVALRIARKAVTGPWTEVKGPKDDGKRKIPSVQTNAMIDSSRLIKRSPMAATTLYIRARNTLPARFAYLAEWEN
jgi:hypothetical protein